MRKKISVLFAVIFIMFVCCDLFAASSSRKKYFSKPQVGAWYGPITPLFDTGDHLNPNLGGGIFFRYNLPVDSLKIGLDTSYQSFESDGVDEMRLIPAYANLLWLLPINLPVRFQLKAGGGLCNVKMEPDEINQWDPMFMVGTEISFPAGKLANIALRLDYLFLYEEHLDDAEQNGHFFNAGISLYFNLNL